MNELLGYISPRDVTVGGVFIFFALLVITDKLVWHTRLKKAEQRAEFWENKAWEAIGVGAAAGVRAAEVTAKVVSSFPDPALETSQSQET